MSDPHAEIERLIATYREKSILEVGFPAGFRAGFLEALRFQAAAVTVLPESVSAGKIVHYCLDSSGFTYEIVGDRIYWLRGGAKADVTAVLHSDEIRYMREKIAAIEGIRKCDR